MIGFFYYCFLLVVVDVSRRGDTFPFLSQQDLSTLFTLPSERLKASMDVVDEKPDSWKVQ
jgi:hypothetical protein